MIPFPESKFEVIVGEPASQSPDPPGFAWVVGGPPRLHFSSLFVSLPIDYLTDGLIFDWLIDYSFILVIILLDDN